MMPVCPKCDAGLFIVHMRDIEVDVCPRCRGVWLDAGELEQLAGATGDDPLLRFQTQVGGVPATRKHLCPRCDAALLEIATGKLTLERCPRGHGLWFDENELAQLLATFPPETGASKAASLLSELFGMQPSAR
jgi:Zn-finger nucleic acid-binding protein